MHKTLAAAAANGAKAEIEFNGEAGALATGPNRSLRADLQGALPVQLRHDKMDHRRPPGVVELS